MLPTDGLPEPKLLMLFEVLYRTGSVTRAAEQLGQSQPTISLWLGKLRQQLRDPLFVRTPGGMKPTPQAEALITVRLQTLTLAALASDFQSRRQLSLCAPQEKTHAL